MQSYKKGANVEVSINEQGFEESYYPATVVSHGSTQEHRMIKYSSLKTNTGAHLTEDVHTTQLRPKPISMQLKKYRVGDIVDVHMRGGWWTVKVVHITNQIYVVEAQHPWEFLLFPVWRLRLHMEYENDVWYFGKVYK